MGRDFVGVQVSGLDALEAAFEELGRVGTKQAIQSALRKAVQPAADDARRLAPRSGDPDTKQPIHDSIEVRTALSKSQQKRRGLRGGRAEAVVYVGSSSPHAHLVEFGHRLVKARHEGAVAVIGRRGRKRLAKVKTKREIGFVRAYPFLRPAFDANTGKMSAIFREEIGKEVVRVAKRYARQAQRGKLSRGAREAFRVELAP